MAPLRIVVVGGGIGGLAAALGLARSGHKVTVYERSKVSGGVGFAFRVTPNSEKCLRYLDIDAEAGGACVVDGGFTRDTKGNVINQTNENRDVKKTEGSKSVFAYRAQLHQQLWDAAIKSGTQMETGVKVVSVDASNSTVKLESGETIPADLIIGADGANSVVRPQVIDTSKFFLKPSTGHNAFRFMIPKHQIQEDELLSSLYEKDGNFIFTWIGDGERNILAYPVDFGKLINIVCTHPEHLSDQETETGDEGTTIDYNQKVSAKTAIDIYSDFDPKAVRLLEMADPNGFRIWKLMDMEELPTWSQNNTVLLGDAGHPVLPFGYSGASMAIEDGLTISTLLPTNTNKEDLHDRLKLYEEIRKLRVRRVLDTSRAIGKARPQELRAITNPYYAFLSGHDAVEHAKQTLAKHEADKH